MNNIIKEFVWRVPCSLIITATIAFCYMRLAGGGAMFCIDPPAADPGWEWKVPLAWITIYGTSAFLGVFVSSFRSRHRVVPICVGLVTVAVFVGARCHPHRVHLFSEELRCGIPALLVAWVLACLFSSSKNMGK